MIGEGMFLRNIILAPFFGFFGLLAIGGTIFWIWMLVDCLQRRFKDKLIWVIVLIFTHLLGAILYYFLVKSKKR